MFGAIVTACGVLLVGGVVFIATIIPAEIARSIWPIFILLGLFRLGVARHIGRRIWQESSHAKSGIGSWLWLGLGEHRTILVQQLVAIALLTGGGWALLRGWLR